MEVEKDKAEKEPGAHGALWAAQGAWLPPPPGLCVPYARYLALVITLTQP